MPELAEVKIMSDFINQVVTEDPFFEQIEKSESSKVKTDLNVFDGGVFTMKSEARGKELLLHLEMVGGDINGSPSTKNLLCTMGMSGNWTFVRGDAPILEKAFKHGHLRFKTSRGNWLILFDQRRFAKWKWGDGWSKGRGPCPLTEYDNFSLLIRKNFTAHRDFKKPLCEVLMNQKWFNGVGNYLRAEIIYRLDVDPFQSACDLSLLQVESLVKMTHMCIRDAYRLGGGQLKDWYNPNGTNGSSFNEWIKCYSVKGMKSIKDAGGRTFWYHPKWDRS